MQMTGATARLIRSKEGWYMGVEAGLSETERECSFSLKHPSIPVCGAVGIRPA